MTLVKVRVWINLFIEVLGAFTCKPPSALTPRHCLIQPSVKDLVDKTGVKYNILKLLTNGNKTLDEAKAKINECLNLSPT